jgi:YidC/Oxa1 family membrane protein insertase
MSSQNKKPSLGNFLLSFSNYRKFTKLPADQKNIVFYSESGQDWHHFEKIICDLLQQNKNVCYVTSDKSDPGLLITNNNYHSYFIQNGFWLIYFFQFLKADCLILTMIDLHIFQLKRSINPVHYIYLFHSMSSTHMVDFENSYDYYDTILCVGPHQIKEIRKRELLKSLPQKNLVKHGYARIENLMHDAEINSHAPVKPFTILIAPTWGENSILNTCGKDLIKILLESGNKVILRPHYQTVKLTPNVVQDILDSFSNHPSFSYISRMGDTTSLFESDILICDWSSTSIEYALGLEKPVLYIDVPKRVRNPNYQELDIEPIEISIRNKVGAILSPSDLVQAPSVIETLLSQPDAFRNQIRELRNSILFNIGNSIAIGAKEIAEIAAIQQKKRINSNQT